MEDVLYPKYHPAGERYEKSTVEDVQFSTYNVDSEETKPHSPHDSALSHPNEDELPRPSSSDRLDENQQETKEKADK
jgi:hypothetical protein